MFDVSYKFPRITLDLTVVNREASLLATRSASSISNQVKLALTSFGAIATGDMLRSIHPEFVSDRPLMPLGVASTGLSRRSVIGNRPLRFVISGRRPGARMPVHKVGTGPRGGGIFEPLPAMRNWFAVLNIPRSAWFPILRAIALRGIPPKPVGHIAVREARPLIGMYLDRATMNIARGIIKINAAT